MKKLLALLLILALTFTACLALASCEFTNGDGDGAGKGDGNGTGDGGQGGATAKVNGLDIAAGTYFLEDGSFQRVIFVDSTVWVVSAIDGETLAVKYSFAVSGNTLTMTLATASTPDQNPSQDLIDMIVDYNTNDVGDTETYNYTIGTNSITLDGYVFTFANSTTVPVSFSAGGNQGGGSQDGPSQGGGDIDLDHDNGGGTLESNCQNGGAHIYGMPEITHTATLITSKYVCGICGHEEIKTVTVDTVVGGEEGWNNAFENVSFNNFTLRVDIDEEHNNNVIVAEDGIYYQAGYFVFYSVKQADGTWTNYISSGDQWTFEKGCDSSGYEFAKRMATLSLSYKNFFSNFTYNSATGTYECAEAVPVVCFDGGDAETLYCFNNVVKVANGSVIYIDCDYSFEEDLSDPMHFIYDNIGLSKVTVPYEVMNSAVAGSVGNPFGGGPSVEPDDSENESVGSSGSIQAAIGSWYNEEEGQSLALSYDTFIMYMDDGSYVEYSYGFDSDYVYARVTGEYYFTEAQAKIIEDETGMSADEYMEALAMMGEMPMGYELIDTDTLMFGGLVYTR